MIEDLKALLKQTVSEKRYIHSIGVADTASKLLVFYRCSDFTSQWNGFNAAEFCGIAHDLAREMTPDQMLVYCRDNSIEITEDELNAPLLLHGKISVSLAEKRFGKIPQDWEKAIRVHTTGDSKMNDLALALFIADFIEPSRTYMTDSKRMCYLSNDTIEKCAYAVLLDMIDHWQNKARHVVGFQSVEMKKDLEERIG